MILLNAASISYGQTKMGPWGGEAGAAFDIPEAEPPMCLQTVTVGYGDVINSVAFSYTNEADQKKTAGPWGSHGAHTTTVGDFVIHCSLRSNKTSTITKKIYLRSRDPTLVSCWPCPDFTTIQFSLWLQRLYRLAV